MPDRITLTKLTYMQLEGQWQLVESGSVLDVLDGAKFAGSSSPVAEPATAITNNAAGRLARAMPVRRVRKR